MKQLAVQRVVAIDDYLRGEEAARMRSEYVAGGIFAMADGNERHNRISLNVAMRLRSQVRGTRCGVCIADMKLRIDGVRSVYYPDVMLGCDAVDSHPLYKTAPCVVVEVLSPSTATIDRREKRLAYLGLPSLQAYVLVEAERRRVEYFRREGADFVAGRLDEDSPLLLPCGERVVALSLGDVYEDVDGLDRPG
jgi:Uma2 family endonuclease